MSLRNSLFIWVAAWFLPSAPVLGQSIDDFFNGSVLHDVRLTMAPDDWATLKDKYLENTYYRCDVEWRGLTVKNAGVRSRGSGTRNAIKPALAIDFSKYQSAQRFLGMKSVTLRNLAQDDSMMQERLTVMLFARMGLPYQRQAHAKVYVNGVYCGLYLMVEPVDTRFINTRFGESDGYLYEFNSPATPYRFEFLGDDPNLYVPMMFEPKNHEEAPEAEAIAGMIRTINQASDEEFMEAVGRYIDLGSFVSHLATEQFVAEPDGILGTAGMANFYFYRRKEDRKAFFVVWDKEETFSAQDWPVWENTQENVLVRRSLAVPELKKRYLETLLEAARVTGGPGGWWESEAGRIEAQISTAAREDPVRMCVIGDHLDPCPLQRLENAIAWVKDFARNRRKLVEDAVAALGMKPPERMLEPGAARNAACGVARLAPGALVRVMAQFDVSAVTRTSSIDLPLELDGVSLRIGGQPAPLVSVGPSDALIQVPGNLHCGPSSIELVDHGRTSNTINVEIRPSVPGVFAVTHLDGRLVDGANPAGAGEVLVAYATGLGMAAEVGARVGGIAARVLWFGLTPGFPGLEQVNLQLPDGLASNVASDLELVAYGENGQPYALAVR